MNLNNQDPENYNEIIENLKEKFSSNFNSNFNSNFDELINIINQIFPNLIVNIFNEYSDDYNYLNNNWKLICDKLKINQQKIIIFEQIEYGENYKLLEFFCETLTKNGFVVRRKSEIIPCEHCNKAIISKDLFNKLKQNNLIKNQIPEKWKKYCSNCYIDYKLYRL